MLTSEYIHMRLLFETIPEISKKGSTGIGCQATKVHVLFRERPMSPTAIAPCDCGALQIVMSKDTTLHQASSLVVFNFFCSIMGLLG